MPPTAPRPAAARSAPVLLAVATAVGVWAGLAAPDVSPASPAPASVQPVAVVLDDDGRDRDRRR